MTQLDGEGGVATTADMWPTNDVLATSLNATVSALITVGGLIKIAGVWQRVLKREVFGRRPTRADHKEHLSWQRKLMSDTGMRVLMIIWKDSESVSEESLLAADLDRTGSIGSPINCHNLAKTLSGGGGDFPALEKTIQGIALAGEGYGLIERHPFSNSRALRGTGLLHDVMLMISREVQPICTEIAGLNPGGL